MVALLLAWAVAVEPLAQKSFEAVSSVGCPERGAYAVTNSAYRFTITKPWCGELPQWPSVSLTTAVRDWTPYDRLVLDIFNAGAGGDVMLGYICEPEGRVQNGLLLLPMPLKDRGYGRFTIKLKDWPRTVDPKKIGIVHLFFEVPSAADVTVSTFALLKPGEPEPPVSERFLAETVRPAERARQKEADERGTRSRAAFASSCRAAGQDGSPAWFGKATSMEKFRARGAFTAKPADAFDLSLARGETEALQALVLPNGRGLSNVSVRVSVPGIPEGAFHVSPVGYVNVVNPVPYKRGFCDRTGHRVTAPAETGWWADPILGYLDAVDIADGDLQSFWVSLRCPRDQRPGRYAGTVGICGSGWRKDFPIAVRVFDFEVPRKSPLPLAVTFDPSPSYQFTTLAELAEADEISADPMSPVRRWSAHLREWTEFLADRYITIGSLYHSGDRVHWDELAHLEAADRLGLFNLGVWDPPKGMDEGERTAWRKSVETRLRPAYEKAKARGLLGHAYLYGCDEMPESAFDRIAFALDELKRLFPGVPCFTTAYEKSFGVGSKLAKMDWFTPTTDVYARSDPAKIAAARKAGHEVWWYIACGQHAPLANFFVECQAIEARQLMGAQAVKFRPDGFLYYQTSLWNSRRCISGKSAFTTWNPRSWTKFHGDGSLICVGPDGTPLSTVRLENFRDGLEDYAYAREYERVTGRKCEVPVSVCRAIDDFTDDPVSYYAWRDGLAEAIEGVK